MQNIQPGASLLELGVRKLTAVQSTYEGDKLAPLYLEVSAKTSHSQRKTKKCVIKVTIMALLLAEYVKYT
jgi:hypothetical protein